MASKTLDPANLGKSEDWFGNNAAFTCPLCGKVFLVSAIISKGSRKCPDCGKSTGRVNGGSAKGGAASLEWEN